MTILSYLLVQENIHLFASSLQNSRFKPRNKFEIWKGIFVSFLPSSSNFLQPSTYEEDANKLNDIRSSRQWSQILQQPTTTINQMKIIPKQIFLFPIDPCVRDCVWQFCHDFDPCFLLLHWSTNLSKQQPKTGKRVRWLHLLQGRETSPLKRRSEYETKLKAGGKVFPLVFWNSLSSPLLLGLYWFRVILTIEYIWKLVVSVWKTRNLITACKLFVLKYLLEAKIYKWFLKLVTWHWKTAIKKTDFGFRQPNLS